MAGGDLSGFSGMGDKLQVLHCELEKNINFYNYYNDYNYIPLYSQVDSPLN